MEDRFDADQCGRARREQNAGMSGFRRIFSTFRMFCAALAIMFGAAIVFSGIFPALTIYDAHFANNQAQLIAYSDRTIPADSKVQDHKAHVTCGAGVCNFAFIIPAQEAPAVILFSVSIERTDIAQLITRIVAPPLPPPKTIILS